MPTRTATIGDMYVTVLAMELPAAACTRKFHTKAKPLPKTPRARAPSIACVLGAWPFSAVEDERWQQSDGGQAQLCARERHGREAAADEVSARVGKRDAVEGHRNQESEHGPPGIRAEPPPGAEHDQNAEEPECESRLLVALHRLVTEDDEDEKQGREWRESVDDPRHDRSRSRLGDREEDAGNDIEAHGHDPQVTARRSARGAAPRVG